MAKARGATGGARGRGVAAPPPPPETIEGQIAAARRRTSMYARDGFALLDEALANVIRAHEAGRVRGLRVELGADGTVSLEDDGPSVEIEEGASGPTIERAVSEVLEWREGNVAGARCSLGLWLVRALSETLVVESRSRGNAVTMRFVRGECVETVRATCDVAERTTRIRFVVDRSIVHEHAMMDPLRVAARLGELAAVFSELAISFAAPLAPGLAPYLTRDLPWYVATGAPFVRSWQDFGASIEVALVVLRSPMGRMRFFANGTSFERGTVRTAVLRVLRSELPARKGALSERGIDFVEVVVSIRGADLRLDGSTRDRLAAPELGESIERELRALFERIARERPDALEQCRRAVKAAR